MNIKRLAGIAILILIFIMGCSGNYANIKNQSEDESKVTQKKLINNWSDYDIWFKYTVRDGQRAVRFMEAKMSINYVKDKPVMAIGRIWIMKIHSIGI